MSILKFIQNLLKIKRFRVIGFSFKNRGRELWRNVKPYKNGRCCPYCNKPGKVIHTAEKARIWLDVVDTRLTNAIAEELNRIIKIAKNRASGFRT